MASQDVRNDSEGQNSSSCTHLPTQVLQQTKCSISEYLNSPNPVLRHLATNYPTPAALMAAYTPDKNSSLMSITDRSRIFAGTSPELSVVNRMYGAKTSESWLIAQLTYVCEFAGVKEKPDAVMLYDLARIIMGMAWYLKMSEIMLFFANFMSGRYGRFYGAVDPLTITSALRTFLSEREAEIAHIEAEDERKQREADRQFRLENAITWEEYQREKESMQQKEGISAGEG